MKNNTDQHLCLSSPCQCSVQVQSLEGRVSYGGHPILRRTSGFPPKSSPSPSPPDEPVRGEGTSTNGRYSVERKVTVFRLQSIRSNQKIIIVLQWASRPQGCNTTDAGK